MTIINRKKKKKTLEKAIKKKKIWCLPPSPIEYSWEEIIIQAPCASLSVCELMTYNFWPEVLMKDVIYKLGHNQTLLSK